MPHLEAFNFIEIVFRKTAMHQAAYICNSDSACSHLAQEVREWTEDPRWYSDIREPKAKHSSFTIKCLMKVYYIPGINP